MDLVSHDDPAGRKLSVEHSEQCHFPSGNVLCPGCGLERRQDNVPLIELQNWGSGGWLGVEVGTCGNPAVPSCETEVSMLCLTLGDSSLQGSIGSNLNIKQRQNYSASLCTWTTLHVQNHETKTDNLAVQEKENHLGTHQNRWAQGCVKTI